MNNDPTCRAPRVIHERRGLGPLRRAATELVGYVGGVVVSTLEHFGVLQSPEDHLDIGPEDELQATGPAARVDRTAEEEW